MDNHNEQNQNHLEATPIRDAPDAPDAPDATPADWARRYEECGYSVIPIKPLSKAPLRQWTQYQNQRPESGKRESWWRQAPSANVGIVTGAVSGGLVDIDLDCSEAVILASHFLPPTTLVHGRASNRGSHRWYEASPIPPYAAFKSPSGATIVELRSDGHYTVVPGSSYPSEEGIERIEWENGLVPPAKVSGEALERSVKLLAACALVAKCWPEQGSRHDCAMALASVLLKSGNDEDYAADFVVAAARAAGDEELEDRRRAVESTARKLKANQPTKGYHELVTILGGDVVERICDWLGIQTKQLKAATSQPTQADVLLKLAGNVETFATAEREAYASFLHRGHIETMRIEDPDFGLWLERLFWCSTQTALNPDALRKAQRVLEGQALFGSDPQDVFVRIANCGEKIYVDLADKDRRIVEIDAAGWRTLQSSPVKFLRPSGLLPLPEPKTGGSVDLLKQCLNLQDESMFRLVVGWLLAAFSPRGEYPIAVFKGEQGSGKSLNSRILRSIIDPSKPEMVSKPRTEEDLMIQATNSFVLCFDNLSGISDECSDSLCRVSSGGGFRVRRFYSQSREVLYDVCRPQVINGIDDIVKRGDLLERSLVFELPRIPKTKRKLKGNILAQFKSVHPLVLGALFDAVSVALARRNSIVLPEPPRMNDFATWATAAEPALGWEPGAFMRAYVGNSARANVTVLEDSAVAAAVRRFVETVELPWEGTATELLAILEDSRTDVGRKAAKWPNTPTSLSSELRRLAPSLREIGIDIDKGRSSPTKRFLRIGRTEDSTVTTVTTVTSDIVDEEPSNLVVDDGGEMSDTQTSHDPSSSTRSITKASYRDGLNSRTTLAGMSARQRMDFVKAQLGI